MSYKIKEIYYTLQGEGFHSGRAAVFCRFSGCNFWTGLEKDRARAICNFCDTDFVGVNGANGGLYDAKNLAGSVRKLWVEHAGLGTCTPLVVCTGGEPLLQMDTELVREFHGFGFEVAVETNGSIMPPNSVDHVCVSPKTSDFILRHGEELKVVFPQAGIDPTKLEMLDFDNFYLQPKDGIDAEKNTQATIQYCLDHPTWKLSLQTHKFLGIP